MAEIFLIALSVVSVGLTLLFKRPVKCEPLRDSVKEEVIQHEQEIKDVQE